MKNIKAGIIGGAGYTGGELIRLLLQHPATELVYVQSNSQAGKPLSTIHRDLVGDTELLFSKAHSNDVDVLFLCTAHGVSRQFLSDQHIPDHIKIIDLSQDFRVEPKFGQREFIYGLPECSRELLQNAQSIANPGCFATAIQLALLPMATSALLPEEVHITGITGATGAGQSLSETSHYSWRNSNISVYKVFEHQHLAEINKSLDLQGGQSKLRFVPYRGPFTRGIWITAYMKSDLSEANARALYEQYYASHPFTHVSDGPLDLKQVVGSNKCLVHIEKHGDLLVVYSTIDNLLKGASGQAVQNMNLMFGMNEQTGLHLKATAF